MEILAFDIVSLSSTRGGRGGKQLLDVLEEKCSSTLWLSPIVSVDTTRVAKLMVGRGISTTVGVVVVTAAAVSFSSTFCTCSCCSDWRATRVLAMLSRPLVVLVLVLALMLAMLARAIWTV